ncbi:MAG: hypothetical protein J5649_02935 [Lachnospiraceae bacterium]|nr:hypothetical protein [Lachnospiraceae bacterium]
MRKIRRTAAALAVMTMLVLTAVACGNQEPEEKTPTATPVSEATPTTEATPTAEATPTSEATPTAEPTDAPATPTVTPSETGEAVYEAKYLGVKDYGEPDTKKENIAQFLYRFSIDGSEKIYAIDNSAEDADDNLLYPIQNKLKEGYDYRITVKDDVVVDVTEIGEAAAAYEPVVKGTPGEKTLINFIKTSMMPVGTTLYVYGGGWDWQDEGSAIQARTLGVSPDWVKFFNEQDENYTFRDKDDNADLRDPKTSYYPFGAYNEYYYAGLDCSGFVGWVVYNTMETESGKDGYVGSSTKMAGKLADRGWGDFSRELMLPSENSDQPNMISATGEVPCLKPGDVISIKGHVWISLGTCDDGSILIVHSTNGHMSRTGQPGGGVAIGAIGLSEECEAYKLADAYMSKYYKEWYRRYPARLCNPDTYLKLESDAAGRFTWNTEAEGGLTDEFGVQNMKPADVLKLCFGE